MAQVIEAVVHGNAQEAGPEYQGDRVETVKQQDADGQGGQAAHQDWNLHQE